MPSTVSEKPRRAQDSGLKPDSIQKGKKWKLAAIWALAIFALVNAGMWQMSLAVKKNNEDVYRGTGSIDLAVNAYKSLPQAPDVVFLGSSLVMFPLWSLDMARDRNHLVDIFHHHGSAAMEEEMKAAGFKNPHVFSLAVFGEMISDGYIYLSEFLQGPKKPEFVVYGIAPRDFSDSDLSSPMTTNTFKRLITLENFGNYSALYLPELKDKLDFLMGHTCWFYGNRARLQQETNKGIEKAYIATGVFPPVDAAKAAGFMMFGGLKERWESSTQEYQRRYKEISEKDIALQMGFLKNSLQVAKERNIKVVVVNMPLSDVNRALLPPGFYDKFCKQIAAVCAQPGVKFVDIGASPEFVHDDFWDTAHLGPSGGKKILPKIIPALKELRDGN